jgi:hypothetical protein
VRLASQSSVHLPLLSVEGLRADWPTGGGRSAQAGRPNLIGASEYDEPGDDPQLGWTWQRCRGTGSRRTKAPSGAGGGRGRRAGVEGPFGGRRRRSAGRTGVGGLSGPMTMGSTWEPAFGPGTTSTVPKEAGNRRDRGFGRCRAGLPGRCTRKTAHPPERAPTGENVERAERNGPHREARRNRPPNHRSEQSLRPGRWTRAAGW